MEQLHSNHMGIEKTWHIVRESVHWNTMNADIEETVKIMCHILRISMHTAT